MARMPSELHTSGFAARPKPPPEGRQPLHRWVSIDFVARPIRTPDPQIVGESAEAHECRHNFLPIRNPPQGQVLAPAGTDGIRKTLSTASFENPINTSCITIAVWC